MLIKPATWFIWVKYSPQYQLRDVVYLTVVAHNVQYLQYFCDDIENSCIMHLKWLRPQSILFYRCNIYWALIWSVYFVSGDHISMRAPCENVNNSLIFWAYPPISPYFFGAPCFRSFSIVRMWRQCHWDVFFYRFCEHYKRWIWSISLKHSTKRPSASFWAFCGFMDQLKRLTSFL